MAIEKSGLILSTDALELLAVPQRIRPVFAGRAAPLTLPHTGGPIVPSVEPAVSSR